MKKAQINNFNCFTAELIKNNHKLYTAWWYQNQQTRTINQVRWRMISLQEGGSPFYLINVTTKNKNCLLKMIKKLSQHDFK